jgi:hypothetical protein
MTGHGNGNSNGDRNADGSALEWSADDLPQSGRVIKAPVSASQSPDRFDGPAQFKQALYQSMALAAQKGWAEMVWIDPDFADWPLGERAFVEHLQAWSAPQRKLVLIARDFDAVMRDQARFVAWRKAWSHLVEAWVCTDPSVSAQQFPSVWLGHARAPSLEAERHWVMQRIDLSRMRGVALFDTPRHKALHELHEELIARSKVGFPAFSLGL